MRLNIKPLLIATVSAITVFSSISHASASLNQSEIQLLDKPQQYQLSTLDLGDNNLLITYRLRSLSMMEKKPILALDNQLANEYMSLNSNNSKGNQLFEFATLFNDKLQQLLAFFASSDNAVHTTKQTNIEKLASPKKQDKNCPTN